MQQFEDGFPIQNQPTNDNNYSGIIPQNATSGLEILAGLDQIMVKQEIGVVEAIFGCEANNRYKIKDVQGRDLFTAKEDTDCCTRNMCGNIRDFELGILDMDGVEVIHLTRPLNCDTCLFPCCLQVLQVSSPPGQLAGWVEQEWNLWGYSFLIKDANGEVVLRIEGPCFTCSCGMDIKFKIFSIEGEQPEQEIGRISKKWSGLLKETFTDADNFGMNFPMDLDARIKAVLLGALFLIDFVFFEDQKSLLDCVLRLL